MEYEDVLLNQPVVFDNGSGTIKAGIAGEEQPKTFFPACVGRPKHRRVMAGGLEGDTFIGGAAQEHRGLLKLRYPLEHGVVTSWDDMERIWSHVYTEELRILSEEHPVLLTEAPLNPRRNRDRCAQVMFETFNVPALYMSIQAVLALYASGRTTGLVLDSGDGVSHAVPVYGGFAMTTAIQRMDIAGRDVTEHLQTLLRRAGTVLETSAEKELVRDIKERLAYVSPDPRREERDYLDMLRLNPNPQANDRDAVYRLPDGRELRLGPERFRAPEVLFAPHVVGSEAVGLPTLVGDAIMRADLDLRGALYESIVLSGGSTLYRGFGDRLIQELKHIAAPNTKIKAYAPPERKYSTWIGGSILAGLSTFKKMWVSVDDWHENPELIHSRCM
ncbi:hypothetical protein TRICI_006256 [Trichomonascus ciferrii]|uniref:Centractin n=1 Tax=Trichomonascus ciferrii TaxID=44093 RepID=A0A642UJ73_9ASCO|nr:hypothetical protein TRICI_006256 [Trichomonascus ciferrii]